MLATRRHYGQRVGQPGGGNGDVGQAQAPAGTQDPRELCGGRGLVRERTVRTLRHDRVKGVVGEWSGTEFAPSEQEESGPALASRVTAWLGGKR